MLILPHYNDIFRYFTTISLYQESRYNDLIPLLPWHIIISGFHCTYPQDSGFQRLSNRGL